MLKLLRGAFLAAGVSLLSTPVLADNDWPDWYRDGQADCEGVTEQVCERRKFAAEQYRLVDEHQRDFGAVDGLLGRFGNVAGALRGVVPGAIGALEAAEADRANRAGDAIREGMEGSRREAPNRERMEDPGSLQEFPAFIAPGFGA